MLTLVAAIGVEAKELYVDAANGNDAVSYAANGPSTPWRSLGRATWGSTSRTSPNANEAARAGDVVIVAAGVYTTTGSSTRFTPAYNPANSGNASNPITFRAASGALVSLQLSGGAGAQIGCKDRNYIIWDGFTIDEATAPRTSDTGVVDFFGSTGCEARNLHLIGTNSSNNDNHNSIRIEQSNFTRVFGNEMHGLRTLGIQGGNDAIIMMYDANDTIIENNTMYDAGVGVYVKGIHPGYTQDRTIIRKNLIYNMTVVGISLLSSHYSKVYQNVLINCNFGLNFSGLSGNEPRDDTFQNNTVHNSRQSGIWLRGTSNAWSRLKFFNNLLTANGETGINITFSSPGDLQFEHNVYQNHPLGFAWLEGGFRSFAQWQSSFGRDAAGPASMVGNPLYVNAGANDFRLCTAQGQPVASCSGASPAVGRGVDVLDINGNGSTTDLIPAGAYITGFEVIGKPGTVLNNLPPAPRNLRITTP
ncbi:MAG: right-handed parallel beta-helix repeat-containing protein [Acidobacteria bacterium]|nr:right-handed parallel beta-helix repeat-containing protein [Acidobacteriota bacterium]